MKILNIRLRQDEKGKIAYPAGFLTFQCLEHLYYDDLKNGVAYLMVLINDADFDKITDKTDVEEITLEKAEQISEQYDKKITAVTDEGMIRAIEIKVRAGEKLSDDDRKALDPNDDTPGINIKQRFIDKVKIRIGI